MPRFLSRRRRAAPVLAVLIVACTDVAGPSRGQAFLAVAAGAYHTCALTVRHRAYCWGRNTSGALGDGTTQSSPVPVPVAGSVAFAAIAAGYDYSCAVTEGGIAYCWGGNFNGQLGDGTTTNRLVPVLVSGGLAFRSLSAGEAHTCGVAADGGDYCWGAPIGPAPGGGVLPNELRPAAFGESAFTDVSAGYEIACAVTGGGAPYCWGLYPPGVTFSDSSVPSSAYPLPVSGAANLVAISAGHKHACGLDAGGAAYCWGENLSGQVGDGTHDYAGTPLPVTGRLTFASVSARGPSHTCGISTGRVAYCWGSNRLGQLGTGNDSSVTRPVPVAGGLSFATVTTGFGHTCGVTTQSRLYCWGYGGFGQLGGGTTTDTREPQPVAN